MKSFIRNLSYAIGSNIISMLVSISITFVIPRFLGVHEYSLLQLYMFYNSYAAFAYFGWADGVLLRYGGSKYKSLEFSMYKLQWLLYILLNILVASVVVIYALLFLHGTDKFSVMLFVSLNIVVDLPKTFLRYILQSTNRIREYANPLIFEKILNLVFAVLLIICGAKRFESFAAGDILGKLVSLSIAIYYCKEITFAKPGCFQYAFSESKENLKVGSKLLLANISSMLIVGTVRFFIEKQWDLVTFGKISLTLSVSNFLMVFINSVGVVLFPMLKRTDSEKLPLIYSAMRTCLMFPLLGMLVCYYPAKAILSIWLPQYKDSLIYMALLFPMCVFESKMSMIINTYLKSLRKEKWLLMVNVVTVFLSVTITLITTYWLHNLDLAVASIVFLLAFRCVCAELLLSTVLDVNVKTDIILELALTAIFIVASWFVGGILGLAIYAIAYLIYLIIKREDLRLVVNTVFRVLQRA